MMTECKHAALELLPERKGKVRCQRCNLTISPEDLGDGFCPECFDSAGVKHYNFEPVLNAAETAVRYRCEECGAIITSL
jgi:predicted RNA-binding Zn-ribbon protein involved in translation (DUF1610 family)